MSVCPPRRCSLFVPQSVFTTVSSLRSNCRQAVSNGFSLTVTILNDTGKDTRTEEYYRGCKLVLRARSLKKFTGLYVAGVSTEGLWEGFEVSMLVNEDQGGGGERPRGWRWEKALVMWSRLFVV